MSAERPAGSSRADVLAAVEELRSIRSTDPCAAIANTTIKATIHTLETRWLVDRPEHLREPDHDPDPDPDDDRS